MDAARRAKRSTSCPQTSPSRRRGSGDAPVGRRRHGGAPTTHPVTRSQLCASVHDLQRERQDLRKLTLRQQKELHSFQLENEKLRTNLAEADLARAEMDIARAGYACDSCSRHCEDTLAHLELERLAAERQPLVQELSRWHSGAATRMRALREHEALRKSWSAERRGLEQAINYELAQLAIAQEDAECQARQLETGQSGIARCRAPKAALLEEITEHRRRRTEAELRQRAVEAELIALREKRRPAAGTQAQNARLEAEKHRLAEARLKLSCETEARRRQADGLQRAADEVEALRKELQKVTSDNAQLRDGLRWTLHSLEQIERRSSGAEASAASALRQQLAGLPARNRVEGSLGGGGDGLAGGSGSVGGGAWRQDVASGHSSSALGGAGSMADGLGIGDSYGGDRASDLVGGGGSLGLGGLGVGDSHGVDRGPGLLGGGGSLGLGGGGLGSAGSSGGAGFAGGSSTGVGGVTYSSGAGSFFGGRPEMSAWRMATGAEAR
eukprot:gnl/TRDRNA2_/TRDRNA2_83993_c0_seq2.p1 gnl/TRDRNA2_/TRDRNA2_83993_c0~~gnl/TRDRNA2_/TRDRNA2_83993_c0_seq2.p1  ORF type:complete len:520 (+),score=101.78 gnl/TRDRNA2_/TRDRNA2_83993_c0_seq2:64-1560(+)